MFKNLKEYFSYIYESTEDDEIEKNKEEDRNDMLSLYRKDWSKSKPKMYAPKEPDMYIVTISGLKVTSGPKIDPLVDEYYKGIPRFRYNGDNNTLTMIVVDSHRARLVKNPTSKKSVFSGIYAVLHKIRPHNKIWIADITQSDNPDKVYNYIARDEKLTPELIKKLNPKYTE